jgi:hypothetical protein
MKHARQKQEDPLNLQSLPMVSPPADGWPAVEAALRQDARRRGLKRFAFGGLAAAAAAVLAVGLYLNMPGPGAGPVPAEPDLALGEPPPAGETPDPQAQRLNDLVDLSQQLESRLRLLRAEGGSLPASAVVYQVELEDLVVQVDEELSRQPDSIALWNQRVNLLVDLERLYQNRLRREYRHYASL